MINQRTSAALLRAWPTKFNDKWLFFSWNDKNFSDRRNTHIFVVILKCGNFQCIMCIVYDIGWCFIQISNVNVVCLCYISCPCISECILCVVLFFPNGVNCHDFKLKWIDDFRTKKFLGFCRTYHATQNAYKIMIFLLSLVSFHFLQNPIKCTAL